MKKLLFALALLMLIPGGAFAASCNPDRDKFTSDQWCITSQDTLIPTASAGMQVVYERYTSVNTNNTLLATESGKYIVDTGGASTVAGPGYGSKHILPRAAVGLTYTVCSGAKNVTVTVDTVDTSDTIENSISGTVLDPGDSLRSTGQAGECLTVISTAPNKWVGIMNPAVWTDNGTN